MIRDRMPDQLKLPSALRNRQAVQALIKEQFETALPTRTINHCLHRRGFTPQSPVKRSYEQNPKKVQGWLDSAYPTIKERSKEEQTEIHRSDETAVSGDCHYGRSYAPKGETPAAFLRV